MSQKNAPLLSCVFKWFPVDIHALRLFRARAYGALRRLLQPIVRLAKPERPRSSKPKVVPYMPHMEQLEIRQMPTTVAFHATAQSVAYNASSITVEVDLSGSSSQTITVNYGSHNDTAYAGTDYTATSGTLTFIPGSTSGTFAVPILGHAELSDVDFNVTLSSPVNATLTGWVTDVITLDEPPEPTVEFHTTAQSVEYNASSALVEVDLSASSSQTVTVYYETYDGSAVSGTDYTGTSSGSMWIAAGSTSGTFTVPLIDHTETSNVEFTVVLTSATHATVGSPATDTITIDEPTPSLNVTIVGTDNTLTQIGNAAVNLNNGDLNDSGIGDSDCGCDPGEDYNSDTADPQPIITFEVTADTTDAPTDFVATLTWDGTEQESVTFDDLSGGADTTYTFSLQVANPVTATDNYDFSVNVTVDTPSGSIAGSASGSDFVVVNGSSGTSVPSGDGWSFPNQSALVISGSNVYMTAPSGNYAAFTESGGTFTFNPNAGGGDDPSLGSGTLAASGSDYIYTDLSQAQWNFNSSGQLTSVVQPTGQTTTYGYTSGLLTSIVKPGNWANELTYSGGVLSSIEDGYIDGSSVFHATASSTYAYDSSNNLTAATDAAGNARTFTYDDNHLMLTDSDSDTTFTYTDGAISSITLGSSLSTTNVVPQQVQSLNSAVISGDGYAQLTDGDGNITKEYLDPFGRPLSIVSPLGATQSFTYDATTGMPLTYTDANGNVTTTSYVTGTRNPQTVVTPDNLTTTYEYGSTWNTPTAVIDGYGRTTTYAFDATTGQLDSTTYPDGSSTSNTYSGGLLQTSVDARGNTTTYDYDSHNEVTAVIDPDHHTTLYAYDLAAHTVTVTQPGGETSVSTYNAQEQLISQTDGNGHTSFTYYTANGQISATVDNLTHTTSYLYDSADRLTATIDSDGHTMRQMYDGAGQVTATVDANGVTAYQDFDAAGNVTATIDANGFTTLYDFSSTGLLTATVDANGHTTLSDYSSAGLLTATVDANGGTTFYDYDSNRRLTATIDPDNRTVQQIYDSVGNVTATIDGNGVTSHQYFDAGDRPTASVDGNGHTSFMDYDAAGNVTATIDANGHTSLTMYDPDGNVTATTDGNGKTSYTDYDLDNRVTASIDADGHTAHQYYDNNSNVTATVDANGHTSLQMFDAANRMTAAVDADGHTSLTMYDNVGNVTATVDANGKTSLQIYDPDYRVTAMVDALGHTSYQQYDHDGNVTAAIDADGHTSRQLYDPANRVTATVDGNGYTAFTLYDPDGNVTATISGNAHTSFQLYDPAGQLTATIDGNGHTSLTYYDGDGQATATVDYNGHTSFQYFDNAGQITATVDADGYTSYQQFDPAGNVTVSIDANGYTTHQAFDGDNQLTQAIDNGGHTASYLFDNVGNLTQSINFDGYTTHQAFDGDGNLTQTIDTTGHTSNQYYDPDGRLTMSIDGDRNTTYQMYDPDGNVTASVDGRGYTSLQMYDANGNVTASVDGDSDTTQYAYDNDGNQTAVIDPDLNTTTMAFDADGQVTQTVSPTSGTTLQSYDGDGNLTQSIDAAGTASSTSILYSYDADDRQTQQLWYASSTLVNTQSKTYDNNGDLLTASDSNGTYTFAYDHDGRLTNVQEPFGVSLNYAYDGDGNQTQVVDSFGGTQTSVYDLQDRLITREYTGESQELRVDFTYGANGQVSTETRYDNLLGPAYGTTADLVATTTDSYDGDGNVTDILNTHLTTTIDEFVYTYDRAGNLSTETDTQQGVTTTTSYSYDDANQLTGAGAASYSYDANGNRPNADASAVTNNQVSNDASWTYTYDANGNLSEKDTTTVGSDEHWTYAYNNKNELTEVKHYDSSNSLELTVDYQYDVFGNLIKEAATTGAGTTTTKFAVDGWNSNMAAPIGLENFNDWAVLNSGNTLQTRTLFGDKVDQVLGRVDQTGASDSAGQYWYLTDHLGSVRDVVDSGGNLKDSVAFDAYGNVSGTELDPNYRGMYAWTGRQVDLETGLQYNRARWYDSTTGRWISQDPLGFDAGDSNLYRYVNNRPSSSGDPSGALSYQLSSDDGLDTFEANLVRRSYPSFFLSQGITQENNLSYTDINVNNGGKIVRGPFVQVFQQKNGIQAARGVWPILWKLAKVGKGGVIVQHVIRTVNIWNAMNDLIVDERYNYYEAFPVTPSKGGTGIVIKFPSGKVATANDQWDTYSTSAGFRGFDFFIASARFFRNQGVPPRWRTGDPLMPSGSSPASPVAPPYWPGDSGGLIRWMDFSWNNQGNGRISGGTRCPTLDDQNY
jgi:RHS repeat-associated protein